MVVKKVDHLMGTVVTIQINTDLPDAGQLADTALDLLHDYEMIFSANDDSSLLMRINQEAGHNWVTVPPILFNLIQSAKEHSLYPNSNLNIAIGPVVKLWHIGFKDAHVPADVDIKRRLKLTNPRNIQLDATNHRVRLAHAGMEIDLGAVAKGYSADLIVNYLKEQGVSSGIVNLGGNVVVIGENHDNDGGFWHVGLQDPAEPLGDYKRILNMKDQSIVTSGIYERNLTDHGHFYHHIIDPQTGYPINTDVASLSIISKKSVDGEFWTSMLFGKTPAEIQRVVFKLSDTKAIIIKQDGNMVTCD